MKIHQYHVYIMTNSRNTVLYTGVTNNLARRCHEHKKGLVSGFTKRYNISKLVYYEVFDGIETAIKREKQIKTITRAKKEALINTFNPCWKELFINGVIAKGQEDPSKGVIAKEQRDVSSNLQSSIFRNCKSSIFRNIKSSVC